MLKSLFATFLTALSVNTQPLAVPSSIDPSNAISEGTTFNVGDTYVFSYIYDFTDNMSISLFSNGDSGTNTLKFLSYSINPITSTSLSGFMPFPIDFAEITISVIVPRVPYNCPIFEFDNDIDDTTNSTFYLTDLSIDYTISLSFEILEGFEGFTSNALPYLTKVEQPYTPPAKSNLYRLLYDFYYSIFNDDDLTAITTTYNLPFDNWLAHTCTIATLITLIVVAFFFLRWLFKVISGLILLKR